MPRWLSEANGRMGISAVFGLAPHAEELAEFRLRVSFVFCLWAQSEWSCRPRGLQVNLSPAVMIFPMMSRTQDSQTSDMVEEVVFAIVGQTKPIARNQKLLLSQKHCLQN